VTQFEYISVAIALVYSLVVTRLIGGFVYSGSPERGSLITALWTLTLLVGVVSAWWIFWRFRGIDWTAFRFLWVLGSPGLLYLRAAVLLTDSPSHVSSWDSHFFTIRRRFFAIGIVQAAHTALAPWVYGLIPWLSPAPAHFWAVSLAGVSLLGLLVASRPVQGGLAGVSLAVNLVGLLITPPV
jgi:hypothetical protein